MDSLLANYVSSDEDEDEDQQQAPQQKPIYSPSKPISDQSFFEPTSCKTSISASFFSSLPKPKSSSFFQSLPQPKQPSSLPNSSSPLANPLRKDNNDDLDEEIPRPSSKTTSYVPKFSSILLKLPNPKSQLSEEPVSISSSTGSTNKRVVKFKPPVNPYIMKSGTFDDDEEEEDDEEKERKRRKESEFSSQPPSVNSFLSFMPAPRNSSTLGAIPSSGSGRRAIVETQVLGSVANSDVSPVANDSIIDQNAISYANYDNFPNHQSCVNQSTTNYSSYQSYENYGTAKDPNAGNYASYNHGEYLAGINQSVGVDGQSGGYGYEGYGNYGYCGQDGNPAWVDGSANAASVPEVSGVSENGIRVGGNRRKNDIPTKIVEVKQDELMKDRPREDQVKLTGIAFGPAYKVSTPSFFFFLNANYIFIR